MAEGEYLPPDHELELFNAKCVKEARALKLSISVRDAMPEIILNCFGKYGAVKVLKLLKDHPLKELYLDDGYLGGEYRAKLLVSPVIVANHKGFVHALLDYIQWLEELRKYPIISSKESVTLPSASMLCYNDGEGDEHIQLEHVTFAKSDTFDKVTLGGVRGTIKVELRATAGAPSITTEAPPVTVGASTSVAKPTTTSISKKGKASPVGNSSISIKSKPTLKNPSSPGLVKSKSTSESSTLTKGKSTLRTPGSGSLRSGKKKTLGDARAI